MCVVPSWQTFSSSNRNCIYTISHHCFPPPFVPLDHESIIPANFGLGLVHEALANYAEALKCYADVRRLNDNKPEQDGNDLTSADILFRTGVVNGELSRFEDALSALESALRIRGSSLGYNNSIVAQTINKIANVQLAQGKYDLALQSFNEVLGLEYEFTIEDRVGVADTLFGKGRICYSREEPDEAMKAYEEALYWKKRVLGEEDIGLASLYEAMGHVHVDKGEVSTAVECFEKAYKLRDQQNPNGGEDMALALKARGSYIVPKGANEMALKTLRRLIVFTNPSSGLIMFVQLTCSIKWQCPTSPSIGMRKEQSFLRVVFRHGKRYWETTWMLPLPWSASPMLIFTSRKTMLMLWLIWRMRSPSDDLR